MNKFALWMRPWALAAAVAGMTLGTCFEAQAALNAYLKLKGQKQGDIKGSVVRKGREGAIAVIAVHHEIISPRDAASGLPTGKRMHKPFVITKQLDSSTPLLYKAMIGDELLPEVELTVFAAGDKVAKTPLYTVKLRNASISEIRLVTTDGVDTTEVSFTYQKIEWTWTEGGITADDDWETPVAVAPTKPPGKPKPKI